MRIRIDRDYTGPHISDLPAGEYDENDPRLQGRAEYLLSIEVAERLPEAETAETDTPKAESNRKKAKR